MRALLLLRYHLARKLQHHLLVLQQQTMQDPSAHYDQSAATDSMHICMPHKHISRECCCSCCSN